MILIFVSCDIMKKSQNEALLLRLMSIESIQKIRNLFVNVPKIDSKQLEDQKKFVLKIKKDLEVLRPKHHYKEKISDQDYEDIALVAALNALNLPMMHDLDNPRYCNNCGKCCIETDPMLLNEEYERLKKIIPNLDEKVDQHPVFLDHYTLHSHPCIFHDSLNKKCIIYSNRPQVCKDYPFSAQEISGTLEIVFVTLPECNYSIKVILDVACNTFDRLNLTKV